jgi:FkbM family methyltransferase
MLDFTRRLTPASAVAYMLWKVKGSQGSVPLRLNAGIRFLLDRSSMGVAYEVFVLDCYRPVRPAGPEPIRRIVDIGANIGFASLYFLHLFPSATAVAFEPHPVHAQKLRANAAANGVAKRLELRVAAAGNAAGALPLSDAGTSSSLISGHANHDAITVDVVDVLPFLLGQRIDLLKIDIEGGEYAILGDPRFDDVQADRLVMEWHQTPDQPDGRAWCMSRLASLGYEIVETTREQYNGLLWAFRKNPS